MSGVYDECQRRLMSGETLDAPTAARLMACIMEGALEPERIGALLAALAMRGATADEIAGFAKAMREKAVTVRSQGVVVDTCGTGGSGIDTPNTSTMVAFVLAAAGVKVAKHGNRSASGRCGSADVLEALGVAIEQPPERAEALLDELDVAFLFAPRYHPAMRHVGAIRRSLGFRTVFNDLGPICNPALVRHQVLGVSDARKAPLLIRALASLGSERVWVVRGDEGLDEISLVAPTRIWSLEGGQITELVVTPEDLGVPRCEPAELAGGDRAFNAELFREVLSGRDRGPVASLVRVNAGAALFVAGKAHDLSSGIEMAREVLDDGAAWAKLEAFREASR